MLKTLLDAILLKTRAFDLDTPSLKLKIFFNFKIGYLMLLHTLRRKWHKVRLLAEEKLLVFKWPPTSNSLGLVILRINEAE